MADDTLNAEGAGQAPVDLVHDEQMLRLYVRGEGFTEPKTVTEAGVSSSFGVYVANEFGLWKRAYWPEIGHIVRITVAGAGSHGAELRLAEGEEKAGEVESSRSEDGVTEIRLSLPESARASCSLHLGYPSGPVLLRCELIQQGARHVHPICSMPVFPARKEISTEATLVLQNVTSARQCREISLGPCRMFAGEAFDLGVSGKVWDAAFATIEWLTENPSALDEWICGKNILELGSGTGLLGIVLSQMASAKSITMTDLAEVVPLSSFNLALNRAMGTMGSEGCEFHCETLTWGELDEAAKVLEKCGEPDVVLLTDVVYEPCFYLPLAKSMAMICKSENRSWQKTLLAYRPRHDHGADFFEDMEKYFDINLLGKLKRGDPEQEGAGDAGKGGMKDMRFYSCVRKDAAAA